MSATLPLPIEGMVGWPWTVSPSVLPPLAPSGKPWPKISIVTPSYNQGQFLEETIRSVLLQGYPNLEYIIMDGGSTDNSVEIIKKYEPWLTYWVSEKDNGQADAIYRGFEKATGEIIGWLNSDDLLLPDSLFNFAQYFMNNPDAELMVGGTILIDQNSKVVRGKRGFPRFNFGPKVYFSKLLWYGFDFNQPATLWRRDVFFKVGGFDTSLFFCFDYDLYLKLTKRMPGKSIGKMVAAYRLHEQTKTSRYVDICLRENGYLQDKHSPYKFSDINKWFLKFFFKKIAVFGYRLDMMKYLLRLKSCKYIDNFMEESKY